MDAEKVFVLILTAFIFGILVYLEMKSRRASSQSTESSPTVQVNETKRR